MYLGPPLEGLCFCLTLNNSGTYSLIIVKVSQIKCPEDSSHVEVGFSIRRDGRDDRRTHNTRLKVDFGSCFASDPENEDKCTKKVSSLGLDGTIT